MKILSNITKIITEEFRAIVSGYAVLLVLLGGIFLYGFLYNYMYEPNVIRKASVAVVDCSRTPLSRHYARVLDATPQMHVVADNPDLPRAKEMMKENAIIGYIYIPSDFDERVGRGEEAVYITLSTTSAFLYYASVQKASAGAMLAINETVRPEMLAFLPQEDVTSILQAPTMKVNGIPLYNYTDGYGTYLIPAVLVVIVFQTLLMVIFMLCGKEWHTHSIARYGRDGLSLGKMAEVVIGKTFVYVMLYAVFSLFLLGLLPLIFQLPHLAHYGEIIVLMIPYLLATCFFGLTASFCCTDSDAPLLLVAFFSVGLIFLSGVSYPLELMPVYWKALHYIIPTAPATLAFVKLNSMGAGLSGIHQQYIILWIQTGFYFITACLVYKYRVKRAGKG